MISGFMNVFEDRLNKLTGRIRKELEKPKKDRDRDALKAMVKDAKELQKLVRRWEEKQDDVKITCPCCNKSFKMKDVK
jgi:hypothetical protein